MSSLLSYKNYNGTVEYSNEDKCLYGKVIGFKVFTVNCGGIHYISVEKHSWDAERLRKKYRKQIDEMKNLI